MKKIITYSVIALVVILSLWGITTVISTNSKPNKVYETMQLGRETITKKITATGKVTPEEEVEVKSQVLGIVDKIYVKEGQPIKQNELIAKIRVVPDEQSLNSANGRVKNAQISLRNAKLDYDRNKAIFDKGVISAQDFQNFQLRFDQAKQELANAQNNLQIIKQGSTGGVQAITNIRASASGTILEIPVEEGDQVIQSNNFNDGTTIATIADMTKMIFEGKVDEAEVDKLKIGMPLTIKMGAIQGKEYPAKLKFIAPKGVEEQGAVQFKIEGDLNLKNNKAVKAGYSANASIVLERKDSILAIREALLQFDKKTEKPYVEVQVGDQKFERREIEIGLSDGVFAELISGIEPDDKIKVWNRLEPIKKEKDTK